MKRTQLAYALIAVSALCVMLAYFAGAFHAKVGSANAPV